MFKLLRRAWEWIENFESAHSIITSEFVRQSLWPLVTAMMAATAGIFGGEPLMWVIMASAVTFMAVIQLILRADELRERKSPQTKLRYEALYAQDLQPAALPVAGNRHQRRAHSVQKQTPQMLGINEIHLNVERQLDKAQIGLSVRNMATFPISAFIQSAETKINGEYEPPRSKFPKSPAIIAPGVIAHLCDDRMDMESLPCQRLTATLNFHVKYGLPGKEIYDIKLKGTLDVILQPNGIVSQLAFTPDNPTTDTPG